MAQRFLALAGLADLPISTIRQAAPDLAVVVNRPGLLVLADPDLPSLLFPGGGVILGPVFAAGGGNRITVWSREAARTVEASRGGHLVHAYWGGYVAFLPTSDRLDVVRAPFGELPCLVSTAANSTVLASDVALLRLAGLAPPTVDWTEMTRFLGEPDTRSSATCLAGVDELRGGERLTIGVKRSTETLWDPWSFCTAECRIDDTEEAVRRVYGTTLAVVGQRVR